MAMTATMVARRGWPARAMASLRFSRRRPWPEPVCLPSTPAPAVEADGMAREDELRRSLLDLECRVGDMHGSVLATRDGLAVATTFGADEAAKVAAMAASVVALADQVLHDPSGRGVARTLIRGSEGCLVVEAVGDGAVLAARTSANPNLGLVNIEMPETIGSLTKLLG